MENQNAKKRISIIVALVGVLALWACFYSFFSSDAYAAEPQPKTERWIESVTVINKSTSITQSYNGKVVSGSSETGAFILEFKIKGKTTKTTTNKKGEVEKAETSLPDEARRVEVMQDLETMKCYKKVGEDEKTGDATWGAPFKIALTKNQVLLKDVEPEKPNTLGELGFKGFKIETYGDFTNAGTHVKSLVIRYVDHDYPTYIKEARANFKVKINQVKIKVNKKTKKPTNVVPGKPSYFSDRPYTGYPIVPNVENLKIGGVKAERDKDYRITFRNNINAGTAKAIIRGIGNFKGSCEYTFTINKANATTKLYKIMSFRTKKKVGNKTYYMISLGSIGKNGVNLYSLGRGAMEKNEVLAYKVKKSDTSGTDIKSLSLGRHSFYVTGTNAAKNINTDANNAKQIIYNCLVYTSIKSVGIGEIRPVAGGEIEDIKKAANLTLKDVDEYRPKKPKPQEYTIKSSDNLSIKYKEKNKKEAAEIYKITYLVNNKNMNKNTTYKFKKGDKLTIKFVPTDKYEGCVPSRTLTYRVYR